MYNIFFQITRKANNTVKLLGQHQETLMSNPVLFSSTKYSIYLKETV